MWLGASRNTAFHVLNATLPCLSCFGRESQHQGYTEQFRTGSSWTTQRFRFGVALRRAAALRKIPDASQDLQDVFVLRSATGN